MENNFLLNLKKKAKDIGTNLIYLNKKETAKIEPQLNVYSSLLSSTTGILDIHNFMLNLETDIINNQGLIIYNSEVIKIKPDEDRIEFFLKNDNKTYKTRVLINSSGLNSHKLAKKIKSLNPKTIPKINYIKGDYFKLVGSSPFKKLIYPLPSKNSLGIHSTMNLYNQTIFGPDEEFIDKVTYKIKSNKKKKFVDNIKKYWPDIKKREIQPDYSGIRTTSISNDFIIQSREDHKINGLINFFGINSPGLTSSLAISEYTYLNIVNKRFVE
jgi:L-2-hydroxyglutarate oxidase LhgO